MTRHTAGEAMGEAKTARAEIKAHEDLCAIRYEGIGRAIEALTKKQDQAMAWIIATLVAALGGAIGMIFVLITHKP